MTAIGQGSKDGTGAGDCDQPFVFGRRPHAIAPWPFTERQYARLLLMRARLADRLLLRDRSGDFTPLEEPRDATEQP